MKNFKKVLRDFKRDELSSEQVVLKFIELYNPLLLGDDVNGDKITPFCKVKINGTDSVIRITYDKYRELFNCGNVYGWYVPDNCTIVKE